MRRAVVVPTSHSIATTPGSPKLAAQHLSLSWAVRRGSVTSSTHDLLLSMLLAALHTGSTALRAMAIRYFCILFPPRGPRGKLTLILLNPCKKFKGILKRKKGYIKKKGASTLTVLRLPPCLVFEDELHRIPERSPGLQQQCCMNEWQRAMPCNPRARFSSTKRELPSHYWNWL